PKGRGEPDLFSANRNELRERSEVEFPARDRRRAVASFAERVPGDDLELFARRKNYHITVARHAVEMFVDPDRGAVIRARNTLSPVDLAGCDIGAAYKPFVAPEKEQVVLDERRQHQRRRSVDTVDDLRLGRRLQRAGTDGDHFLFHAEPAARPQDQIA